MSIEDPLWGAPRIHGELRKLGFDLAQSSWAKYMIKQRGPGDQGWRTFLRNHTLEIAAMDLFAVPTVGFRLLYAFIIIRLDRRYLVWINTTTNPTAEWVARQITEAFPWDEAPNISSAISIKSMVPSSHGGCSVQSLSSTVVNAGLGYKFENGVSIQLDASNLETLILKAARTMPISCGFSLAQTMFTGGPSRGKIPSRLPFITDYHCL